MDIGLLEQKGYFLPEIVCTDMRKWTTWVIVSKSIETELLFEFVLRI